MYDSKVGFLDLKALSLKNKSESENKNKLIAYMKPLMIIATDGNTINHDNYQFYFNKLLTLKGIKIQNAVLTKEMIKTDDFRLSSTILGIIGTCFLIYNYLNPDTTVRTAGHVASHAIHMLNRTSTLLNYAYGSSSISKPPSQMFHNGVESNSEDWNKIKDRSMNRRII